MNQFLIPLKSSHDSNTAAQPEKLLSGKIWVALFPGIKTPVNEGLIARITAYAIATTIAAPELQ